MPLTFHHKQLANGLDIIAEVNPDSHSFAAGLFVKTGSRDEDVDVNGVSHFLEHMMFKGSAKYTWEDVNRIFDEMGAQYNAFTSQEMTAYYANVLPEFTEQTDRAPVAPASPGDPQRGLRHREESHPRRDRDVPRRSRPPALREADGAALREPPADHEHPRLGRVDPEAQRDQMADVLRPPLRAGEHGAGGDGAAGLRRDREAGGEVHGRLAARRRAAAAAAADVQAAAAGDGRPEAQPPCTRWA